MKQLMVVLCSCGLLILSNPLLSADLMSQGNDLFNSGKKNIENYRTSGDVFVKETQANPRNYEAAWKAARSYRYYADETKKKNVANWKAICKEYGKLGMMYGEKAIALNQNGVEGNTWFGFSVASYADSVSVLTALKEGLKDKTQKSFEKAYSINKKYENGGPIKALGRFWFVLPWPLQDKKLSLKYMKEFQALYPDDPEGRVYLAEVLIKTGSKEEARSVLLKTVNSNDKYYADWAKRLLADL